MFCKEHETLHCFDLVFGGGKMAFNYTIFRKNQI